MENLVELTHLTKRYGTKEALSDLSLTLPEGRIVGLLGPNGSGKTTLLKILAGMLTEYRGTAKVGGMEIGPQTKAIVAYLPDRPCFQDWMRVRDAVELYAQFFTDFDQQKALEMLRRLQVEDSQKIKALSKGMVDKLQLCLTMARNARLYLLDEPIGGVDPAARDFILDTILGCYNEKGPILLSTHLIADVERIFDTVLFLNSGRITLNGEIDAIREERGMSIDQLFREEFKC